MTTTTQAKTTTKYFKFLTLNTVSTHGWRTLQADSLAKGYFQLTQIVDEGDSVWKFQEISEEEYRLLSN